MTDTRKIERAYVEAGIMPLADYVAKYGDCTAQGIASKQAAQMAEALV